MKKLITIAVLAMAAGRSPGAKLCAQRQDINYPSSYTTKCIETLSDRCISGLVFLGEGCGDDVNGFCSTLTAVFIARQSTSNTVPFAPIDAATITNNIYCFARLLYPFAGNWVLAGSNKYATNCPYDVWNDMKNQQELRQLVFTASAS